MVQKKYLITKISLAETIIPVLYVVKYKSVWQIICENQRDLREIIYRRRRSPSTIKPLTKTVIPDLIRNPRPQQRLSQKLSLSDLIRQSPSTIKTLAETVVPVLYVVKYKSVWQFF